MNIRERKTHLLYGSDEIIADGEGLRVGIDGSVEHIKRPRSSAPPAAWDSERTEVAPGRVYDSRTGRPLASARALDDDDELSASDRAAIAKALSDAKAEDAASMHRAPRIERIGNRIVVDAETAKRRAEANEERKRFLSDAWRQPLAQSAQPAQPVHEPSRPAASQPMSAEDARALREQAYREYCRDLENAWRSR